MKNIVLKLIFLFLPILSMKAQNALPIENIRISTEVWAVGNLEHFFKKGNILFLESNLRHTSLANYPTVAGLPFYQINLLAGYEIKLAKRWGLGISNRFSFDLGTNLFNTRLYVVHSGNIKSIEFVKQINAEIINYTTKNYATKMLSAAVSLAKNFTITPKLRPRLVVASEIYKFFYSYPFLQQRTFDRVQLRLETNVPITKSLSLGVFAMLQSDYYVVLGNYSSTGQLLQSDRRLNINTHIIGFRGHWLLKSKQYENTRIRYFAY